MIKNISLLTVLLALLLTCSDNTNSTAYINLSATKNMSKDQLKEVIERLAPLHSRLPEPKPGDWLYEHHEPGQSLEEFINAEKVLPDEKRKYIYIQPIGKFGSDQEKVLELTKQYIRLFFNLKVREKKPIPISKIPLKYRRIHPAWGVRQILSGFVMDGILKPNLPEDAAVFIAISSMDLWPGKGWNFVFGQASLVDRVGVWSIYRYGDPSEGADAFKLCLRRTMAVATHEIGHMFGMMHCIEYECNMNGSNSLLESDSRPLWLCPECMAKLCQAMKINPTDRYNHLHNWFTENNFTPEANMTSRSIDVINK
jgi:archaemetzincin